MDLNFNKEKYELKDFFLILIYFITFFISFGAISLISHKKLFEGILEIAKVNKKIQEKENKFEILNNLNFFLVRCLGMVFGYIFNRFTNIIIYSCSQKLYNEYFLIIILSIYGGSYIISIIFYLIFDGLVASSLKHKENGKQNKKQFLTICGYLFYYEKIPLNDNKAYGAQDTENDKLIANNINSIKKNNIITNNENNTVIKIPDNKVANEVDNTCDKICSRFFPCFGKSNKYSCASCKLGFRKCYYNTRKIGLCCESCKCSKCCECCKCCKYCKCCECCECYKCCECCKCEECCSCCPYCQCCLCCKPLKLEESYEEEEIFCYAYKVQRKCSWFCDLLWNNYFISLIICNILNEIGIIGFEKKLNEDLEKNKLNENLIKIIIYLLFFILYAILGRCLLEKEFGVKLFSKNFKKFIGGFIFIPVIFFFFLFMFYIIVLCIKLILQIISKIFF